MQFNLYLPIKAIDVLSTHTLATKEFIHIDSI